MKKSFSTLSFLLFSLTLASCELVIPSFDSSADISASSVALSSLDGTSTLSSAFSSSSPNDNGSSSDSSSSEASSASSENEPTFTYTGYYQALNGIEDGELITTLRPLLRQALASNGLFPSGISYESAIGALQEADQDPNDPNKIIVWYRMTSVNKTWDKGVTWNREHVWPQSLMNVSTSASSRHKGADVHNLKPANPSDNSSRGNKYFSETTTEESYAPPTSIRGDIARMMFYMVTMYPDLSLVDGKPSVMQMAQFSLIVKWHLEDPVDAFETRRNQILYEYQGNRNPFIDHEELVCRMFRHQTTQASQHCLA